MSEVKVNKITPRTDCGTTQLGDSGDTVTVTGDLRSDSLKAADGGVIISQSGTTITVGASGDTVSLASGASQSGFGRSGSVDWQTGSIKTSTFTAASGEGYFCDTSSGAFTVNLPAGSAGAIVSLSDYTRTFQTNNLTISPNGSEKIGGVAGDATLETEGQTATFVYVDGTEGWINTQETSNSVTGRNFVTATGGTITTCGNFKIHTFTGPGTFAVSTISTVPAENTVGYQVVAGGGGGGFQNGGGGGGGGFREGRNAPIDNFTASPLVANAPTNAVTLTAASFPIAVGGGGAAGATPCVAASAGVNSTFSTITSAGGGGGGHSSSAPGRNGTSGGSGGGASYVFPGGTGDFPGSPIGNPSGNTPPVSPSQGNNGGYGFTTWVGWITGGGGGGAGAVGTNGAKNTRAPGGNGVSSSITGSSVARAGGGGAGIQNPSEVPGSTGGTGGGGASSSPTGEGSSGGTATAGTANTGGGGGANGDKNPNQGAAGGSGIVIIRYKFQ